MAGNQKKTWPDPRTRDDSGILERVLERKIWAMKSKVSLNDWRWLSTRPRRQTADARLHQPDARQRVRNR